MELTKEEIELVKKHRAEKGKERTLNMRRAATLRILADIIEADVPMDERIIEDYLIKKNIRIDGKDAEDSASILFNIYESVYDNIYLINSLTNYVSMLGYQ